MVVRGVAAEEKKFKRGKGKRRKITSAGEKIIFKMGGGGGGY